MKVFIDTSAFVALFIEKEMDHAFIAKQYITYRQGRAQLFTSHYILDELFTRLLYYKTAINLDKCIQTLKASITRGEVTVLQIDDMLFHKAIDIFLKFSEHTISFTDATTYMLCKNYSLDEVFTLDSDFKKMGITVSS